MSAGSPSTRSANNRRFFQSLVYLLITVFIFNLLSIDILCADEEEIYSNLILSATEYKDDHITSIWGQLFNRIESQPFNLIAALIFALAILHTFVAHRFTMMAHNLQKKHRERHAGLEDHHISFSLDKGLEKELSFPAEIMHFLGEIEVIFGLWLIPLLLTITYFFDWTAAVRYFQSRDFTEPVFVVVIMILSCTRPIVKFSESCLIFFASMGGRTPSAWWLTILTLGPPLGSLVTEPAAMTLCATLLSTHFYQYAPSQKLSYATLGLLFTNISVGGVLTHFSAPPVLMVAKVWQWDTPYMFFNFGWRAVVGIFVSTLLYFLIFRKEFAVINQRAKEANIAKAQLVKDTERPIPLWITITHLGLMAWTVIQCHYPILFIGSFLLFLAFYQATVPHQSPLNLRSPILVGCFLAGLVIHGGLQSWWITAALYKAEEGSLMIFSMILTAFNDNAAITYLSTLVPNLTEEMKYALVAGAVTAGGLTVIANAPNPAGQSLLSKHFKNGVSPAALFIAALTPTIILGISFWFLG